MPLRDHFHPPLSKKTSWDMLHGAWPTFIVLQLNSRLPPEFSAGPLVHLGAGIEVDVGAFEPGNSTPEVADSEAWLRSQPSVAVETELLRVDNYEVLVYDQERDRRLVAAIEIVSPSNKDRPESRQIFVARCEELLRKGVSVSIVDIVTEKHFNLYTDLLALIDLTDPTFEPDRPSIYAAACRWVPRGHKYILETWSHTLHLGQSLPTLPIWIAENFAVSLDLESSYEEACRALRIT
ncbi:MAG: DUF4058 family protein [Bacteroidales bacterium]|nr:DUF4058 family protein [Bacteroidales bacterium]